jgi:hypothetical protein
MTFKKLLIALFVLFSTTIIAQKPYNVILKNEQIKIPICGFQIDSIIDNRHHQRGIGMIKKGRKDRSIPTFFENNFITLKDYKYSVINSLCYFFVISLHGTGQYSNT